MHHLRKLAANFIIFERKKCKSSQTAGALLEAESDGGAEAHLIRGLHSRLLRQAMEGGKQEAAGAAGTDGQEGKDGGARLAGEAGERWGVSCWAVRHSAWDRMDMR